MKFAVTPSSIQANPLNTRALLSTKAPNKPRGRRAKRMSFYERQRANHGVVYHCCIAGVSGVGIADDFFFMKSLDVAAIESARFMPFDAK